MHGELPGRFRAAGEHAEAVVDPPRELPLERRVAGVGRQHRPVGGEPAHEELERRRPQRHRARERHPVGVQAVARDLIDHHRVEVVHHRVAVAAECVGGDRR